MRFTIRNDHGDELVLEAEQGSSELRVVEVKPFVFHPDKEEQERQEIAAALRRTEEKQHEMAKRALFREPQPGNLEVLFTDGHWVRFDTHNGAWTPYDVIVASGLYWREDGDYPASVKESPEAKAEGVFHLVK